MRIDCTKIFRGGITADTALRLGRWFGTSAEFWFDLQKLYELRRARREIDSRLEKLPRLADRKPKSTHIPTRLSRDEAKLTSS